MLQVSNVTSPYICSSCTLHTSHHLLNVAVLSAVAREDKYWSLVWKYSVKQNPTGRENLETLRKTGRQSEDKTKKDCVGKSESKRGVRERPSIGFVVGLSCLLVLRDQPIPPWQEDSGLSQRTQAALLAKAPWHGCGCCCQSVTGSSYSLSLLSLSLCYNFSPVHAIPPSFSLIQSASHMVCSNRMGVS